MKPFIQITRHLYEEPHHLNLVIIASNGQAKGALEFYLKPEDLEEIGTNFLKFPLHDKVSYLFERGSEQKEANFGWYLRLEASSPGGLRDTCTLRLRFNNNEHHREFHFAVDPQMTDFGINMSIENARELGKLLSSFSKLEHHRLYWTPEGSALDNKLVDQSGYDCDVIANAFNSLPQ